MALYCIWSDDTSCEHYDLPEYREFMGDEYVVVEREEDEELPTYNEVVGLNFNQ